MKRRSCEPSFIMRLKQSFTVPDHDLKLITEYRLKRLQETAVFFIYNVILRGQVKHRYSNIRNET